MKLRTLFSSILLLSVISLFANEYNPAKEAWLQENLLRAGINTCPYEFEPVYDTPAPKGFHPFYISHYGRHGSRSDWGRKDYSKVISVLSKAKEQQILTKEGYSLLSVSCKVMEMTDGMDGRLSRRGAIEHQRLAERMYRRYKQVFKKGNGHIRSISSYVPRCLISMNAFTASLASLNKNLTFYWDAGEKFQKYISNDCPKSLKPDIKALTDSIKNSFVVDTVYYINRLFTDYNKASKLVGNKRDFQWNIFRTLKITGAFDIDTDLFNILPIDFICQCEQYQSSRLYMGHCNSVEYGKQVTAEAKPLLADIVDKADEVIATGSVCSDLRFGHDYTVLSLSSLMGLEGVGQRLRCSEIATRWFGARYTPFAANIQIIFYRNSKNDILVKFLLNEKETLLLGLAPKYGPYYGWNDVRKYFKDVIAL